MSISNIIARGYGSFGDVLTLPTLGYGAGTTATVTGFGRIEYTMPRSQLEYTMSAERLEYTLANERLEFTGVEP